MISQMLIYILLLLGFATITTQLTVHQAYYMNDQVIEFIYGENGIQNYMDSITIPHNAIKCKFY